MNKKSIFYGVLFTLAALLLVFALIIEIFFVSEPRPNLILKAVIYLVVFSVIAVRYLFINIRGPKNMLQMQYLPFFVGAFEKDKKNYRKLLSIGRLLNKSRFEEAYTQIERLKKECIGTYDRVAILLAETLCLNGRLRYDTAFSVLEQALSEHPNHVTALALRALLLQQAGMPSQADELLRTLAPNTQHNYAVHLCKAVYHYNRGEYTAAVASAKEALAINSSSTLTMLVAYKSTLAMKLEDVADYYLKLIKKYGKTVKELEIYSKTFLLQ